ncbi:HPr kinase/phosphatase C-terminal domain-containing protein [Parvibaculum sp.]|uniref:HPr kinase/phosphorylase n=1 Tax=Parvibaculum sp. TaxID=2024848 RepID=UPI002BFEBED5|nr:HPr kinase/phosphatase C-terminal domain-containing protein [Parvibaculum sp.]HUD53435.1 HPr kinase/phosphatase C-terminal domain-containing protein [Parvibaculum sp.]
MTVLVHGTCVLIGPSAVLLRGPSGSGKSDLAFRLIRSEGPSAMLVADDQVVLEAEEGRLLASSPPALAGLLEVRGLGLIPLPFAPRAEVVLVIDLVAQGAVPRLPEPRFVTIESIELPLLDLHAFDLTAMERVRLAVETIPAKGFPGDDGRLG